jgi:hypothetical protein
MHMQITAKKVGNKYQQATVNYSIKLETILEMYLNILVR